MNDLQGCLLLFLCDGSFPASAICFATHGPYSHVEIAIDNQYMVGAHLKGIQISRIPRDLRMVTPVTISPFATQGGITNGLGWATKQTGRRYGWMDIVYQAVKFLNPNNRLRIAREGRWDCSDFATRYLQQAGVVLPDQFNDAYANTPNDLARIFGLLPPRDPAHDALIPLLPFGAKPMEVAHG